MGERMAETITIVVLAGAIREERKSIHAARYIADYARQLPDVMVEFVDPQEVDLQPLPGDDHETRDQRYHDITARADAFYIVTPEYNHSYPGSLKRVLDSEFENYYHKPVAIAGASSGRWGGVRACEALLPVMHTLGMPVIKTELYFPRVQEIFDATGTIRGDQEASYRENLKRAFDELLLFARAFKKVRQGDIL